MSYIYSKNIVRLALIAILVILLAAANRPVPENIHSLNCIRIGLVNSEATILLTFLALICAGLYLMRWSPASGILSKYLISRRASWVACAVVTISISLMFTPNHANAAVIYRPVSAWGGTNPAGLIDQTGYTSGVTDLDAYLSTRPNSGPGYWNGPSSAGWNQPGFDLGSTTPLTGMLIWQASNYYRIAISKVEIGVRSDTSDPWTSIGTYYLPAGDGIYRVNFQSPVNARYVVWLVYENFGNGHSNSTEVDEVAFYGEPIPEPTSLSLLAFGGFGLLLRRRNTHR